MKNMKCSRCGKENKDTAKYCSECGAPLEQPEHSGEEKKKTSGKNKWLTGAGIVILIAVLIAVGMVLFQKKKEKEFQQLVVSADRYLEEMDYQKAEDSYREILKVDPSRKSAYTGIIQAYYYQGEEEKIEEVINDAEEHISDTEGFDEILYWQEAKRRIQTYLDFMAETEERIPRDGYEIKDMRLQTYGLSFLKNVDFDADGIDEFVLAYLKDDPVKVDYALEVWAYKDGKMENVYTGDVFRTDTTCGIRFACTKDEMIQLVTGVSMEGIRTYYAYKDGKFVQDMTIEMSVATLSRKINGKEATNQELAEYAQKYSYRDYYLEGYDTDTPEEFAAHAFDKTKMELEYQLKAVDECYKHAIEKANGEQTAENKETDIQDGNYISVSDESGMYLNVYTEEKQKKFLQIGYYYLDNIFMNFETVKYEYDEDSGSYREVSEEPSHNLLISQDGNVVSISIENKSTGYKSDVKLQREAQYDSVEAHEKSNEISMDEAEIHEKLVEHYKKGTEDSDGDDLAVMQGSVRGLTYSTIVRCGMPGNPSASQRLYDVEVNMNTGEVTQTRVLTDNKVVKFNLNE